MATHESPFPFRRRLIALFAGVVLAAGGYGTAFAASGLGPESTGAAAQTTTTTATTTTTGPPPPPTVTETTPAPTTTTTTVTETQTTPAPTTTTTTVTETQTTPAPTTASSTTTAALALRKLVTICHRTKNARRPYAKVSVRPSQLRPHLRHGDILVKRTGKCPTRVVKTDGKGHVVKRS